MIEKKVKSQNKEAETCVLVGLLVGMQREEELIEHLDELAFLAETAGAKPVKRFTQKVAKPDGATFVGSGKMEQIREFVQENKVDLAIFDDELSPSQQRNIEKILKCKILDRTTLILDIFAARAQTAHAKTQVELAQYQYLLPRLTGMWTHLEKQRGGIGMKGPGEKEIETDRRIVRDKISLLKDKLKTIDKQMATQRKNRGALVRVALVGYTNVGKSTIMNLLSKSEVFAENKLFATLDTTVRKMVIHDLPFLLSDTVGFIRKLPTHLVESFKSTLDEVREADVLLHVVDISHPAFEDHIRVVNETLKDIKAQDKPIVLVFNKIDAYKHVERDETDLVTPMKLENFTLDELKKTYMAKYKMPTIFISAMHKENVEELKETIYHLAKTIHLERYPHQTLWDISKQIAG